MPPASEGARRTAGKDNLFGAQPNTTTESVSSRAAVSKATALELLDIGAYVSFDVASIATELDMRESTGARAFSNPALGKIEEGGDLGCCEKPIGHSASAFPHGARPLAGSRQRPRAS